MNAAGGMSSATRNALSRLGVAVRRITSDSRAIAPGDAFAAYPGEAADGRIYIPDALRRGAGSVLWEEAGFTWHDEWRIANAGVRDLKHELGCIAHEVYGHPSDALWTVGVTGTNGKTSCSHWIAQALTRRGRMSAVVGTLGNGFAGRLAPTTNTTPDAAALHEMLAGWRAAGAQGVAMEVSSHGLAQGRVNGVVFDVALFTNLTRDHLDYHETMEAYGAAKARLFDWPGLKTAVINRDDAFGRQLIERCRLARVPVLAYGQSAGDVTVRELEIRVDGFGGIAVTPWGEAAFSSGLIGSFNVSNALGVLGVLLASGVPLREAAIELARLEPVAGRMQKLGGDDRPLVIVDYAHTPDALEQVLRALRPVADARGGRLVAAFGCGGDRDPGKRPQMGAIAARLADDVVVTSDNPRTEVPESIVAQIVAGATSLQVVPMVIVARDAAIAAAIARAGPADVVLVAGKGHEPYQEINGVRHTFSDLDHAQGALDAWRHP